MGIAERNGRIIAIDERAALDAVAQIFPQKRVDADVASLQPRIATSYAGASIRLRFDKVALEFASDLTKGLRDAIPSGKTAVVTIAAPIRQSMKTAAELQEKIRRSIALGGALNEFDDEIQGNAIFVRFVDAATDGNNVLVFVHNPDSHRGVLLDMTASLVECLSVYCRARERSRWLVIANNVDSEHARVYREVHRAIGSNAFRKVFMVFSAGRVEELTA